MAASTKHQRAAVRTLDDIMNRIEVDEVTGCWVWQGGCQASQRRRRPVVWLADEQRAESARRAAWVLSGRSVRTGFMVFSVCENELCVCPDHMRTGTMKQLGAYQRKTGCTRGPHRSASSIRSWAERKAWKLSPELVQWARESEQSSRVAAHGLMCSATTVIKVRSGERRPSLVRGASIFSLRA